MAKAKERTGRQIKQRLSAFLEADDFHLALRDLRELPPQRALHSLLTSLCEQDEKRKWRAVSAVGLLAADLAGQDMEAARALMRRLMWSLNDESGSIGWGAPEAMAEIMAAHEGLAEEYAHMLVSYMRTDGNYLENPHLQRGLLYGIGRLAETRPDLMRKHDAGHYLPPFLESGDRVVRGLAAWCAGVLGVQEARSRLPSLMGEDTEITLYVGHRLVQRTTGRLAREALGRLDEEGH